MTYTKGPWRFTKTHPLSTSCWYVITDAEGYGPIIEVGGTDKNGQIAEAKYLVTDPAIIEANARLIAAAPELLEACKKAKIFIEYARYTLDEGKATIGSQFPHKKDADIEMERLEQAIAKAEDR